MEGLVNVWSLAVRPRLHYFVQPEGGTLEEHPCAVAAEAAGQAYARRGVPAVAYMMMGDPEVECWDEPEMLGCFEQSQNGAARAA